MKCSKCGKEMEKGTLYSHGMAWTKKNRMWLGFTKWITGNLIVFAFRCPSCQSIELKTDIK